MTINRGTEYERTKFCEREKAFADLWEEENKIRPCINFGMGIAQDLMVKIHPVYPNVLSNREIIYKLTGRERIILATVIQWLGTNCGWCFLEMCLKKCGYKIVKI